ncbi:MAG: HEAT repeat domain-containing protein, partial [Gemmataceae bacterium]
GLGAWLTAPSLRAWYVLRGLRAADEAARPGWAAAVAGLGEAAVDPLLAGLAGADGDGCAAGLDALLDRVPPDALADRLVKSFAKLPADGRARALTVLAGWLDRSADDGLHRRAADLLPLAAAEPACLEAAVGVAAAVMGRPRPADVAAVCRTLAREALASPSAAVRVRAVSLCLQPGLDLLEPVAALLKDPAPEVRRAALVAVGPAEAAVTEEALLPCLHDPDGQVRELARSSLLARGLRPEQIELGRLLTHARSRVRLEVLDRLAEVADLDPGVWLRRLSLDGSPAVRAAAARAMGLLPASEMSDRLEQMARTDPSPTVARLARYYLAQRSRLRTVGSP